MVITISLTGVECVVWNELLARVFFSPFFQCLIDEKKSAIIRIRSIVQVINVRSDGEDVLKSGAVKTI